MVVILAVVVLFVNHCPSTKTEDKENDDACCSGIEDEVASDLPEDFES
jgi:hypothetical protein